MTARTTAFLFTSFGLGQAPDDLQRKVVAIFLSLVAEPDHRPSALLFYTEGVKLVCDGSPVIDQLRALERDGVDLVVCKTCLDHFGLTDRVRVGVVGGMPDLLEAMARADKVITV